jgi:hypothetical protein
MKKNLTLRPLKRDEFFVKNCKRKLEYQTDLLLKGLPYELMPSQALTTKGAGYRSSIQECFSSDELLTSYPKESRQYFGYAEALSLNYYFDIPLGWFYFHPTSGKFRRGGISLPVVQAGHCERIEVAQAAPIDFTGGLSSETRPPAGAAPSIASTGQGNYHKCMLDHAPSMQAITDTALDVVIQSCIKLHHEPIDSDEVSKIQVQILSYGAISNFGTGANCTSLQWVRLRHNLDYNHSDG